MNQVDMKATIGNVFVFNKIENIHSFQLKFRITIHSPKHENSSQMEIIVIRLHTESPRCAISTILASKQMVAC
jgi:hypothetical protein